MSIKLDQGRPHFKLFLVTQLLACDVTQPQSHFFPYPCSLFNSDEVQNIILAPDPAGSVHFTANFGRRHEGYPLARPLLGTFSKSRRRRQRGHGKTKDLMGRTVVQHVRFQLCTFFSLRLQKQQHEITKIFVVCEWKPRRQIILISIWNSTLLIDVILKLRCGAVRDGKHIQPSSKF